jgi:hypothetical protein
MSGRKRKTICRGHTQPKTHWTSQGNSFCDEQSAVELQLGSQGQQLHVKQQLLAKLMREIQSNQLHGAATSGFQDQWRAAKRITGSLNDG